jgi:hypothetical protein
MLYGTYNSCYDGYGGDDNCDFGEVCCLGYDYTSSTGYTYGDFCEDSSDCSSSYSGGTYSYSYDDFDYHMQNYSDAVDTMVTAVYIVIGVIIILIGLCVYCCCCKKQKVIVQQAAPVQAQVQVQQPVPQPPMMTQDPNAFQTQPLVQPVQPGGYDPYNMNASPDPYGQSLLQG